MRESKPLEIGLNREAYLKFRFFESVFLFIMRVNDKVMNGESDGDNRAGTVRR